MDKKFWIEKWHANEIGFHQKEVNPYLLKWWNTLDIKSGDAVFVPLCGKSRDMLWLLRQGYKVIGIEISQQAAESFFEENKLPVKVSEEEKFTRYDAQELSILCGDFFDLTNSDLKTITAVYDRASLIALPPEMRERYVEHIKVIMPDKSQMFLVTMEYAQEEMNGPPFSVKETEVRELYADQKVELLLKHNVLFENQRFKERGLTSMIEKVFLVSLMQHSSI